MPQPTPNLWLTCYRLIGTLSYPLAVLVSWTASLLARWRKGSDSSFRERLGFYPQEVQVLSPGKVVWVHAASAGEVNAVTPFCLLLKEKRPDLHIVITTSSRTGRNAARDSKAADAAFLAPLDIAISVRRAFRAFRPALLLVAETEFWPVLFDRCAHNAVPLVLVNGRLSDRHFPQYRRFRSLFGPAVGRFSRCLLQTPADADKLSTLGVPSKRMIVAGQMKYDVKPPDPGRVETLKRELGLADGDDLFTLGSVRDGEEDLLFPLLKGILASSRRVRVIVAPRHMKNVPLYGSKLDALGLQWVLRSGGDRSWRLMVLDTFGELTSAYALSRGVFVGGTLVPVGGHNLVEPALSKVPVCYGPHTANVREADEALIASGGGVKIPEASELTGVFLSWADARSSRESGRKAFAAVESMRGATEKTLAEILRFLPE